MTAETPLMIMGRLNQAYLTLSGARAQLDSMDEHIDFVDDPDEHTRAILSDPHLQVLDMHHAWLDLGNQITLVMAQLQIQRVALAAKYDLHHPHELQPVRSRTPARIVPRRSTK